MLIQRLLTPTAKQFIRPKSPLEKKMVLTNAQTTAFFENRTQMVIPRATVMQLFNEGIATVSDLVKFDRRSL